MLSAQVPFCPQLSQPCPGYLLPAVEPSLMQALGFPWGRGVPLHPSSSLSSAQPGGIWDLSPRAWYELRHACKEEGSPSDNTCAEYNCTHRKFRPFFFCLFRKDQVGFYSHFWSRTAFPDLRFYGVVVRTVQGDGKAAAPHRAPLRHHEGGAPGNSVCNLKKCHAPLNLPNESRRSSSRTTPRGQLCTGKIHLPAFFFGYSSIKRHWWACLSQAFL